MKMNYSRRMAMANGAPQQNDGENADMGGSGKRKISRQLGGKRAHRYKKLAANRSILKELESDMEMLNDEQETLKKGMGSLTMALGDIKSVVNEELIKELLPQLRLALADLNAGVDGAESRAVTLLDQLRLTVSKIDSLPTEDENNAKPAGLTGQSADKGAEHKKGKRSSAVVFKELESDIFKLNEEKKLLKKAMESQEQEMGDLANVVNKLKQLLAQLHGVYTNVMNICAMVIAILSKPASN